MVTVLRPVAPSVRVQIAQSYCRWPHQCNGFLHGVTPRAMVPPLAVRKGPFAQHRPSAHMALLSTEPSTVYGAVPPAWRLPLWGSMRRDEEVMARARSCRRT